MNWSSNMQISSSGRSFSGHVLMTADTVGGVWGYALELCRALARFKVHVSLATVGPPATARHRRELRELRNVDLYEGSGLKLEWMEQTDEEHQERGDWVLSLTY